MFAQTLSHGDKQQTPVPILIWAQPQVKPYNNQHGTSVVSPPASKRANFVVRDDTNIFPIFQKQKTSPTRQREQVNRFCKYKTSFRDSEQKQEKVSSSLPQPFQPCPETIALMRQLVHAMFEVKYSGFHPPAFLLFIPLFLV